MPRIRAARLALIPLVICTALLPIVPASAAPVYKTTVAVSFKFPAFHGTLKSPKPGCTAGRTVVLYKMRPGPDKQLKQGTSTSGGRWSTPIGKKTVPSGTYYVKAAFRGKCKAGKSRLIPVA